MSTMSAMTHECNSCATMCSYRKTNRPKIHTAPDDLWVPTAATNMGTTTAQLTLQTPLSTVTLGAARARHTANIFTTEPDDSWVTTGATSMGTPTAKLTLQTPLSTVTLGCSSQKIHH